MDLRTFCIVFSAAFALLTKLADIVTTDRYVGIEGESNPVARRIFEALGLRRGMAAVYGFMVVVVAGTAFGIWASGSWLLAAPFSAACFAAGLAHLEVARYNKTHRHSWISRVFARGFAAMRRASSRRG